jgi:hypothetical protein
VTPDARLKKIPMGISPHGYSVFLVCLLTRFADEIDSKYRVFNASDYSGEFDQLKVGHLQSIPNPNRGIIPYRVDDEGSVSKIDLYCWIIVSHDTVSKFFEFKFLAVGKGFLCDFTVFESIDFT